MTDKPKQKPQPRRLRESNDPMDLLRMQTEFALIQSMLKSKTLTVMVIVAVLLVVGAVLAVAHA